MKKTVKITQDKKLDIAYIQFKKGKIFKTSKLQKGIIADFDKSGNILGLEILMLTQMAPALSIKKKAA
jgi:uncharacterized protein YuzE